MTNKTKECTMFATSGLDSFKIWVADKEAICDQCETTFQGIHSHKIKASQLIKTFQKSKGAFSK